MRKFRKKYRRPQVRFNTQQIKESKEIKQGFGLRRSKELWKTERILRELRQRARELIAVRNTEKERQLLGKLVKMGLLQEGAQLDDVLGLRKESILERRLQTVILRQGFATTPRQARQTVVHGHVSISGKVITFPSYLVSREEEGNIVCRLKPKTVVPVQSVKEAEGQLEEELLVAQPKEASEA